MSDKHTQQQALEDARVDRRVREHIATIEAQSRPSSKRLRTALHALLDHGLSAQAADYWIAFPASDGGMFEASLVSILRAADLHRAGVNDRLYGDPYNEVAS